MHQMEEELTDVEESLLLDLNHVAVSQRGAAWREWVRKVHHGLTVTELAEDAPVCGQIRREPLGDAQLLQMQVPRTRLFGDASAASSTNRILVVLLVQEGAARLRHAGHESWLNAGQLCVIDAAQELEYSTHSCRLTTLHLPSSWALHRHPSLLQAVGRVVDARVDAGVRLFVSTLGQAQLLLPQLDAAQRSNVLNALVELLRTGCLGATGPAMSSNARIAQVQAYLEAHLGDPGLDPDEVARRVGLSRRHLDALMVDELGQPLAEHLWSLRVQRAAERLRAPEHAHKSITAIAFELGFGSSAHFSRRFRARHGMPPVAWRAQH